ncbi:MAG: hypothetical protein M3Z66_14470 [Chloroflexota bacterium]|nr:hypothetical protein [Chloroflexota bacterium]
MKSAPCAERPTITGDGTEVKAVNDQQRQEERTAMEVAERDTGHLLIEDAGRIREIRIVAP